MGLFFDFDNWVLWIPANIGNSFNILTFDFILKPPQPATGLFLALYIFDSEKNWLLFVHDYILLIHLDVMDKFGKEQ